MVSWWALLPNCSADLAGVAARLNIAPWVCGAARGPVEAAPGGAARGVALVEAVLAMEARYDGRAQRAEHKGGTVALTGPRAIKGRALEEAAQARGKRLVCKVGPAGESPTARACDDVGGAPARPIGVAAYITASAGAIRSVRASPAGGGARQHLVCAGAISSETARNLLARPEALDVWVESRGVVVWAIPPRQIIGGLSERPAVGEIYARARGGRWKRPRFCGESRACGKARGR